MPQIPIQNVYYLLCYAWDQMEAGTIVETGAEGHTELADLFAQMLVSGTRRVLRQGLDRGYETQAEATARIRGRIDFSTSLKQAHLPRAQAHCHYDELSRNVLHNRILRTTIRQTSTLPALADRLQDAYRVERPQVQWDFDATVPAVTRDRFPGMQTDIALEPRPDTPPDRALIIDTKFYGDTLQAHHDRQSYHSANLYQLFTYLKNAETKGDPYTRAEGLLLYPTTGPEIRDAARIQGHRLRIATIDLAQDWPGIRRDLLRLIEGDPT